MSEKQYAIANTYGYGFCYRRCDYRGNIFGLGDVIDTVYVQFYVQFEEKK